MVTLYVGGRKVAFADAEKIFGDAPSIELRNDAGQVLVRFVRESIEVKPDDPDWVKAITPEEIEKRMAEPGYTFEEVKKRLGWE